jgi:hypothetical protein
MINKDLFKKQYTTLCQIKQIAIDKDYVITLWDLIKNDFTDEQFQYACREIIKNEQLYNKQPDPNLFYKYKASTEITKEKQASIEAEKVIEAVDKFEFHDGVMFDNPITTAVIRKHFGGWKEVRYMFNEYNQFKRSPQSFKKEFIETWLDYYDLEKKEYGECMYQKGDMIGYVGEKEECIRINQSETSKISTHSGENKKKVDELTSKLFRANDAD